MIGCEECLGNDPFLCGVRHSLITRSVTLCAVRWFSGGRKPKKAKKEEDEDEDEEEEELDEEENGEDEDEEN